MRATSERWHLCTACRTKLADFEPELRIIEWARADVCSVCARRRTCYRYPLPGYLAYGNPGEHGYWSEPICGTCQHR